MTSKRFCSKGNRYNFGEAGAKMVITARREEWSMPTCEELERLGIECLALKTDISKLEDMTDRAEKESIQHIAMGRLLGQEGELRSAVLFAAGKASSYNAGQMIYIDGAISAW